MSLMKSVGLGLVTFILVSSARNIILDSLFVLSLFVIFGQLRIQSKETNGPSIDPYI